MPGAGGSPPGGDARFRFSCLPGQYRIMEGPAAQAASRWPSTHPVAAARNPTCLLTAPSGMNRLSEPGSPSRIGGTASRTGVFATQPENSSGAAPSLDHADRRIGADETCADGAGRRAQITGFWEF
jgi:hypothetical protein